MAIKFGFFLLVATLLASLVMGERNDNDNDVVLLFKSIFQFFSLLFVCVGILPVAWSPMPILVPTSMVPTRPDNNHQVRKWQKVAKKNFKNYT